MVPGSDEFWISCGPVAGENGRCCGASVKNFARNTVQHAATHRNKVQRFSRPARGVALRVCRQVEDRKSTRLNSSHSQISYAVFCLKKKRKGRRASSTA